MKGPITGFENTVTNFGIPGKLYVKWNYYKTLCRALQDVVSGKYRYCLFNDAE